MCLLNVQCDHCATEHQTHSVFFGQSFHFLVKEEVDGESVAGFVSEHSTKDFTVLVAHSLSHMKKYRVVDLLNMDPAQERSIRLCIKKIG